MKLVSDRAISAAVELDTVSDFFRNHRMGVPDEHVRADLTFGNPHEMPLPKLVDSLKRRIEPRHVDWFAYKSSEQEAREVVARALKAEYRDDAGRFRGDRHRLYHASGPRR